MNRKVLKAIRLLLFLSAGIFLFWFAFRNQDFSLIREKVSRADWRWAAVALLCGLLSNLFRAYRWNMLIHPLHYKPKLSSTFHSVMIGYLVNLIVPRLGELTRCVALSRYEKIPATKLVGTVIVERVMDVVTILLLLVVTILLESDRMAALGGEYVVKPLLNKIQWLFNAGWQQYLLLSLLLITLFFAGKWIYGRLRKSRYYSKVKEIVKGFFDGLRSIAKMENKWLFLFHTVMIWLMYYLMSFVCFFSFDSTSHLGIAAGLAVLVFGGFGYAAPVQGGIGTFHIIVTQVMLLYGISEADGLSYAFFVHSLQTIAVVTVGLISGTHFFLTKKTGL